MADTVATPRVDEGPARMLAGALVVLGLTQLVLAVSLAPGYGLLAWLDATRLPSAREGRALFSMLAVAGVGGGLALGAWLAAWAVLRRAPWATAAVLVISLFALPSVCGPGSLVVLALLSAYRGALDHQRTLDSASDRSG